MKYILSIKYKLGNSDPIIVSDSYKKLEEFVKDIISLLGKINKYYIDNNVDFNNLSNHYNQLSKLEELFIDDTIFFNFSECLFDFGREKYYKPEDIQFLIHEVVEI